LTLGVGVGIISWKSFFGKNQIFFAFGTSFQNKNKINFIL
jgi:hypothetical protein